MQSRNAPAFLRSGGRTASLLSTKEWTGHPLGAPEDWPLGLQQSLGMLLPAASPMALFWGEEPVLFFNDAFARSVALGAQPGEKAESSWPSGWHSLQGLWAAAMEGQVVSIPDYMPPSLPNLRLTLDFSPIIGLSGETEGVLLLAQGPVLVTNENLHSRELEKLNQIIENSPDYMSMASLEGKLTYMNKAGRKLVGLMPYSDLSQLSIRKFYGEEQYRIVQEVIIPALQQFGRWSGEVQIRHLQTGANIPCFAHYQLIPDPHTGEWISRALTLRDLRPEREARQAAAESDNRFRNLVEEAAVATAIYVGPEMRIQWANDAMLQLWGKDRSVVGMTLLAALPELEGQPFLELLQHVFTTGNTYDGREDQADLVVEGRLQTFYFNFFYKALRDSSGAVYGILNMAMDVTEQVFARRRLEASERNFRQLIAQAPVGIALLRAPDFVFELTNENYCELVGKDRIALEGLPLLQALPELRGQGFQELLRDVLASDQAYRGYEMPVRLLRNGQEELIYCNFVYEPLKGEEGDRVLVVVINITQQVEARQRVEVLEERLRMAVDAARMGTFEVIDGNGKIFTSDRFNQIFNLPGRTEDPQVFIDAIHPDFTEVRMRAHQGAKETGKLEYEVRVGRDGDPVKWIQVRGEFLKSQGSGKKRLVGIVLDVTERKSLEAELERRVQERTHELTRMNEELQQFAYVTSHDLKEPLRKMRIFSDLLAKELEEQEGKKASFLQKITSSATRMDALVQSLLDYSRLSHIDDQFIPTDLHAALRDVLVDFELLIEEKQAQLEIQPLPVITAIPLQIHQLFHNLVGNALKFAHPDRPLRLQIDCEEVSGEAHPLLPDPAKQYLLLRFTDNGIGFDPQFSAKIFTIFQKLHTRDVYAGTGIGLAVCRKIAENHGGTIEAHSEPEVGSVFQVYLPLQRSLIGS